MERPNRWPWPPLIVAGLAVAAMALDQAVPTGAVLAVPFGARLAGGAVMALGVGLDLWAMRTMRRHRANILPHRAATALVTDGPFAVSRNPIYLANTLLLAGAGLLFGNAWLLPAALGQMALVDRMAIRREEAHLATRFGAAWAAYAADVPRWLRLRRAR
jgi:protein-S-isoprenylcysteine O-methyltransferase Ste14